MDRKVILILSTILFSVMASGCYEVNSNFSEIKNEILSSSGSHYYKDVEFALGSVSMSFVRIFVNDEDDDIIKNISGIQIAVYKGRSDGDNNYNLFQRIDEKMQNNGWKNFVRESNPDELTLIYFKDKDEKLYAMFIVSVNKKELSLVQLNGDLNKVIIASIRKKGNPFDKKDL